MALLQLAGWLTQPLNRIGSIVPGGLVNFYETGTVVRKDTYADALGNATNENPVELDGYGMATIFLADDGAYDIVFTDGDENLIWTREKVISPVSIEP